MEGEIDRLRDLRRYFEPLRIRHVRATQVVVADRTLDVVELDLSSPLRAVYVDRTGRVLRADIDPHPVSKRRRWIRLLFPSAY